MNLKDLARLQLPVAAGEVDCEVVEAVKAAVIKKREKLNELSDVDYVNDKGGCLRAFLMKMFEDDEERVDVFLDTLETYGAEGRFVEGVGTFSCFKKGMAAILVLFFENFEEFNGALNNLALRSGVETPKAQGVMLIWLFRNVGLLRERGLLPFVADLMARGRATGLQTGVTISLNTWFLDGEGNFSYFLRNSACMSLEQVSRGDLDYFFERNGKEEWREFIADDSVKIGGVECLIFNEQKGVTEFGRDLCVLESDVFPNLYEACAVVHVGCNPVVAKELKRSGAVEVDYHWYRFFSFFEDEKVAMKVVACLKNLNKEDRSLDFLGWFILHFSVEGLVGCLPEYCKFSSERNVRLYCSDASLVKRLYLLGCQEGCLEKMSTGPFVRAVRERVSGGEEFSVDLVRDVVDSLKSVNPVVDEVAVAIDRIMNEVERYGRDSCARDEARLAVEEMRLLLRMGFRGGRFANVFGFVLDGDWDGCFFESLFAVILKLRKNLVSQLKVRNVNESYVSLYLRSEGAWRDFWYHFGGLRRLRSLDSDVVTIDLDDLNARDRERLDDWLSSPVNKPASRFVRGSDGYLRIQADNGGGYLRIDAGGGRYVFEDLG